MSECDVFMEALQRPDPAERAAYLETACGGDAVLRRRIEMLLEAHVEASGYLKASAPFDVSTLQATVPPPTDGPKLVSNTDLPETERPSEASANTTAGETKLLTSNSRPDSGSTADWLSPSHFGHFDGIGLLEFEILAQLGRGGMGVVYKARHLPLNRIVALKMIGDGQHGSPEIRERFLIEAEAVARFHHPNIVQIYDFGEADGRPYVTLELLEGGSLADRLKGTTPPGREAAELVETLAIAMHAAHQAGIVHRDLKPPNVLFARDNTPKIADFGLAKRLEVEDPHTVTGQIMGTPSYMAPEQAQGDVHKIGPPADIYALGAILYEMLTGRPPFKGSSMMETLHQVVYDDVVPPSRMQPRIARDLETICLKCLEKEPSKRYGTAVELAEDLRRFLENHPIRARRTPLWERGAKWVRRNPTATSLIGLAAAGVVALVMAYGSYQDRIRERAQAVERQVARQRARSEKDLETVQEFLLAKRWNDGKFHMGKVLTELGTNPRYADLEGRARQMLDRADRGLREDAAQFHDRQQQRHFVERRDEAFLREAGYTNLAQTADIQKTRTAAVAALKVFADDGPGDAWTLARLPGTLPAQELADIRDGCYELLLTLADAVAQPLAGEDRIVQADRGLRILDQALAIRAEPTPAFHRTRAACLDRKDDLAGAKRERAAAGSLRSTTVLDHFLAGREGFKQQDWKTAFSEFETVRRLQPGHFWASCLSAIASLQTNQPGMAKLALSTCIDHEPNFAWLHILQGVATGQAAVQARVASKTLKRKDGSIEAAAEGQFDAAEDDYQTALRLLEKQPDDELRWSALVNRALMRFQRARLSESAADLEEAIRLNGQQYHPFASLAQVLQRQKKWDEASARFTQAIERQPALAPLYRGRAAVGQERDDQTPEHRAAALHDLEAAIRYEQPGNSVLADDHIGRGELLRRDRRLEDALAACDAALKVAPNYDRAHRLRVKLLLDLNRSEEVIRSCDGALARGEPWPELYEVRGVARAIRGDYAGAIDDYSHALVLNPGQSRVLSSRGVAYLLLESPRPALIDFDEALRLDPSNGEAHSGRGLALALRGDHRAAIAEAEESLRNDAPSARRTYNAARIYAQAALAAAAEVESKGRTAVALVERYQDRAVALVKLALERTPVELRAPFWQDQVAADPALRPLQRRLRLMQPPGAPNSSVTRPVETNQG